jgi:plasmid stability protein
MHFACKYDYCMSKHLQIRNVPDDLHRRLKVRAALSGMSLSEYLLREIKAAAMRPTPEEFRQRLERRASVKPGTSPAKAVRAERDRI